MYQQPNEKINFMKYVKPYLGQGFFSIFLVIIRSIILLTPPLLTKFIIDHVIPENNKYMLVILTISMFMVPVVTGSLIILDLYVSSFVLKVAAKIRTDIYNGLQYKPIRWFVNKKANDIIQRLLDETERLAIFFYQGIGSIVWVNVTIITGLIFMTSMSYQLTIILVVLLVIQSLVLKRISNNFTKKSKILLENQSEVGEHIRETLTGIDYIKSVGKEEFEVQRFIPKIDKYTNSSLEILKIRNKANISRVLLNSLAISVIYLYGGILVLDGGLTIGALVAFAAIYVWIAPAILSYQDLYLEAKNVTPSIGRIKEIYFPLFSNKEHGVTPQSLFPISGKRVSLFDDSNKRKVFENVEFDIQKGKHYAVIGRSGSGKSTLIDILLGLINPSSGKIYFNGLEINQIDKEFFKKEVFCVSQEVSFFNGTILENIKYVNMDASEEEIWEAMRICELTKWIKTLPKGIDTNVGELGAEISGGEKQRIGIARAILRKPQLLVLDESTSALDYYTEMNILTKLKEVLPATTIIFVTHRTNILPKLDEIIELQ
ncbi:ABC transporter ATP-binding protein [Bacillus cereus]|uniref:ABC transporter ATP-binding protein n=1 Tax=Bacillus cereus TaxID=1396 RepID=UPI00167FFBAE|nr:ABC transporter ATP-binding protein [Bacillus cereus]